MRYKMSRREWCDNAIRFVAVSALAPAALLTTGCPAIAPVILRAGATRLSGVLWGAVRTRAAATVGTRLAARGAGASPLLLRPRASALTIKALMDVGERYLSPAAESSDLKRLEEEHAPLTIIDKNGTEFENTPYGIYEDIGVIQSCYDAEPRFLFAEPDFDSQPIRRLDVEEEVGIFDLNFTADGWYRVQTVRRDEGWVHGNCLEELPASKYYN